LAAGAGVPPIRLHDLRHGAASLTLAAGGELKVVQAMLGHASIVLTADTYTSVLPCLAHQSTEATAALVMQAAHHTSRKLRGARRDPATTTAPGRAEPLTSGTLPETRRRKYG
jgi:integrase